MKDIKLNQVTYNDFIVYLSGKTNFVKSDIIIANIPEIKNDGTLRFMVNTLRQLGHPIISSSSGYKYSDDTEQIIETVKTLRSRALKINQAADGMERKIIEK